MGTRPGAPWRSLAPVWLVASGILFSLAPALAGAQQRLTRPDLKCLGGPGYNPGAGITYSRRAADDIAWLNVKMLRVEFIGENDPAKTINYAAYDHIVDEAAKRGARILGLLDYQTAAWSDRAEWATDAFRARFVARTAEIAAHYASRPNPIRHWEIWNEEDLNVPEFNVRIEPEPYARLLAECYTAIKSIDAGATVTIGGISPKGFLYATNYLNEVYNAQATQDFYLENGFYPFDVVAVHPYPETFLRRPGDLAGVLNTRVKAIMDAHGDSAKKVWLTEMGWNSSQVSENYQATCLTQTFLAMDALPYVERYFWFCYQDFGTVDLWGLYAAGGRKKPSWTAFFNLTEPGPEPPQDYCESCVILDPPVWNGTSDADLPYQVLADDLLAGRLAEIVSGGFHGANVGGVAELTNGLFDSNPLTLVLADYSHPALHLRYRFETPVDLREVRVFAGHSGDTGNRAFQSVDFYVNGQPAALELLTGPYGAGSGGARAVSLLRWAPPAGETHVARRVETLEILSWCVSDLNSLFLDRWDPIADPDRDTDGAGPAFVAPILKEIDALGEPSPPSAPRSGLLVR